MDNKAKQQFENLSKAYLAIDPNAQEGSVQPELEVKFGSKQLPITYAVYSSVVRYLKTIGFTPNRTTGTDMLRIIPKLNAPDGQEPPNIRFELEDVDIIRRYCEHEDVKPLISELERDSTKTNKGASHYIKVTEKLPYKTSMKGEYVTRADFTEDFNFKIDLKTEKSIPLTSAKCIEIMEDWKNTKKLFRHMNRVQFSHPDYPFVFDISVVRSNRKVRGEYSFEYTAQEAKVFNSVDNFEIEMELDNSMFGKGCKYTTVNEVQEQLRRGIRIILTAMQNSSYPISNTERREVLNQYIRLMFPQHDGGVIKPRDFVGPASVTLELQNVIRSEEVDGKVPYVFDKYVVTEKADGERALLYVSEKKRVYLIDSNMRVMFTGLVLKGDDRGDNKSLSNVLLDGEFLEYTNEQNKFVQHYAAFDVYFIEKHDLRKLPFMNEEDFQKVKTDKKCRHNYLHTVIQTMNRQIDVNPSCPFIISKKNFHFSSTTSCDTILKTNFPYKIDGLIFTPYDLGVAGTPDDTKDTPPRNTKVTWIRSFKWKPPHENTIDFLVTFQKDKNGDPMILYETKDNEVKKYYNMILRCSYSKKRHGRINPFNDIIQGNYEDYKRLENDKYLPTPFIPTNPGIREACYLTMETPQGLKDGTFRSEDNDIFTENMIVEFRYEFGREPCCWVPIRVRHDKTYELLSGGENYGNAYHVANSVWHSIHNPVTKDMITGKEIIPRVVENTELYYNRVTSQSNTTKSLRDFHNLYVKKNLIGAVAKPNDTLIDYAVGKAGDLAKWSQAKLSLVLGIDVHGENIHDNRDGACARYVDMRVNKQINLEAFFAVGNSSFNLKHGSHGLNKTYPTENDERVVKMLLASMPNAESAGQALHKHYGAARDGFQISSCQFALHYFFKNVKTLSAFLRNVAECTKVGGYFVATCFDGNAVFRALQNKKRGETKRYETPDGKLITRITKLYSETSLSSDVTSLGKAISVFQESINKEFEEYLVSPDYLNACMETFGFTLAQFPDAEKRNLPLRKATASFRELFEDMKYEIQRNPENKSLYKTALDMEADEGQRELSFLNRYFIYQKTRNVQNLDAIVRAMIENVVVENTEDEDDVFKNPALDEVTESKPSDKTKPKAVKKTKSDSEKSKSDKSEEPKKQEEKKEKEPEQKKEPVKTVSKGMSMFGVKPKTSPEEAKKTTTAAAKKPRKLKQTLKISQEEDKEDDEK